MLGFLFFYLQKLVRYLKNFGWLVDDFFGRECEFVQFTFGRYHRNTTILDTMSDITVWTC